MSQPKRSPPLCEIEARLIHLRDASRRDATVTSISVQLDAAKVILSLVQNQIVFEHDRAKYIDFAARVVNAAETRLWKSALRPEEVLSISSQVERLWFAIDALT